MLVGIVVDARAAIVLMRMRHGAQKESELVDLSRFESDVRRQLWREVIVSSPS